VDARREDRFLACLRFFFGFEEDLAMFTPLSFAGI
jgi:hypothetical protein